MTTNTPLYPTNFSHIGLTVPDLDHAIAFYTQAMGWYHISGPISVQEDNQEDRLSLISRLIYGTGWTSFRFAHLASADGIGFEIFEFKDNRDARSTNDPFRTGISHFCMQDPNIEALMSRIIQYGGKQKSDLIDLAPGVNPYRMVYMEDPYGNLIEIYTHAYVLHNS